MEGTDRHLRFSLRHVAVLFAVIAGILTWYVYPVGSVPRKTGRELDAAIFGKGWFVLTDSFGNTL